MRFLQGVFIALSCLALVIGASGQENPHAINVDEFGSVSCGDFLSRMDYLLSELNKNPKDVGYVLISEDGRNPAGFIKFATANLHNHAFDRSRIKIFLTRSEKKGIDGSLWRVPPGADAPEFSPLHLPTPDPNKAFKYGSTFAENVCPSFSPDLFAEFIRNNPGSKARIVIAAPTVYERLQAKNNALEILEKVKLPRNQIGFYFIHRRSQNYISIEYWYLPPKRR